MTYDRHERIMIELQVFQLEWCLSWSMNNNIWLHWDLRCDGIDKLQITEDSNVSILYNSIGDGNMFGRHEDYYDEKLEPPADFITEWVFMIYRLSSCERIEWHDVSCINWWSIVFLVVKGLSDMMYRVSINDLLSI